MTSPWMKPVAALLALLLCACTYDRTDHPVIGQIVGKPLTTKRPTVLAWSRTGKGTPLELDWDSRMVQLYDASRYDEYSGLIGPALIRLPAGTSLRIDSVKVFASDSSTCIKAFGVITHRGGTEPFFYTMGYSGSLVTAPWELPQRSGRRRFDVSYEHAE